MRVAAIFGPGGSVKDLKPFQSCSAVTWISEFPGNANDADAILILGGDGTVHRHLTELVHLQLPVLVVPCGSGNDFARALGLRTVSNSLNAWREFSRGGGNVRTVDLGTIVPLSSKSVDEGARPTPQVLPRYFCCVAGVGLDGEVARRANRLPRWLRAHGGYVLSLLPALAKYAPVSLMSAAGHEKRDSTLKALVVAAFANAPAYGGGMKIAPRAKLDDDLLDVCLIGDMGRLKLLCLFPTIYFGRHLSIGQVEYFRAERLRVETESPVDVYADGEFVCRTPIEVGVARSTLRVITG